MRISTPPQLNPTWKTPRPANRLGTGVPELRARCAQAQILQLQSHWTVDRIISHNAACRKLLALGSLGLRLCRSLFVTRRKTELAAQPRGQLGDAVMGAVAVGEFLLPPTRGVTRLTPSAQRPGIFCPNLFLVWKAPLSALSGPFPIPRSHWLHVLSIPGAGQ
jgi:hypothetical protein